MTNSACHQAVIEAIGKLYTLQNDERILHAALSKSLAFEYRPNKPESPFQAPTTATFATATDSDLPTENEMKELRKSIR